MNRFAVKGRAMRLLSLLKGSAGLPMGLGLLLVLVASCSTNSKMENLLKQIPADADLVAVGNMKSFIESAGGSVEENEFQLPKFLTKEFPSGVSEEYDDLKSLVKRGGIDSEAIAVTIDFDKSNPILVFGLNDSKKFVQWIEDEDFREKKSDDDAVYYAKKVYESTLGSDYDDYDYIAVKGDYAYWIQGVWVGSDFDAIRELKRVVEQSGEQSFAETQFAEYILEGNLGGVSISIPKEFRSELKKAGLPSSMANIYDGVVCIKGNLSENKVMVQATWFDEDGTRKSATDLAANVNLDAKVNNESLAYLNKDEFFVYAVSLEGFDWDGYMNTIAAMSRMSRSDRASLSIVSSYLEKINGTVAFGLGLKNGLNSMANLANGRNVGKEISATMIIETKPGKAKGIVNDMKGLLDEVEITYKTKSSGFSISLPDVNLVVNVEAHDNLLVISNQQISAANNNPVVENIDFSNYLLAGGMLLKKSNPLMEDLEINRSGIALMSFDPQQMEVQLSMEIESEENVGFVGKCIKTVLDIVKQEETIERKFE